ncbi:MAG: DUF1461 domain-containing protein [Eubacteriaceae bacterium]|nr:DUF1461 domain-containing protein [Eubacteriaceae bacterium]
MIGRTAAFLICCAAALMLIFAGAFAGAWLLTRMDGFFERAFAATGADEATGIALNELMEVHRATVSYIKGGQEPPVITCMRRDGPIEFYKEDELRHLSDVRDVRAALGRLFAAAVLLLAAAFGASLMLPGDTGSRCLKLTSVLTALWTVFGSFMFEPLFTALHRILFPGGNWIFYPDISLMVNLYSEGVFIRCGAFMGFTVLLVCLIPGITGIVMGKRGKKKWKKT